MKANEFIIEYKKNRKAPRYNLKPRNPVAHAAQSVISGSGQHKDKKKAAKQGDVKHKNKQMDIAEGYTTEKQILTRIRQIMYDRKLSGTESNTGELNRLKQQLKDMRSQQGVAERVRDPEDWDEGNTEPGNNFAVYINGKKWKVFPGPYGAYADSPEEEREFYRLKAMAQRKSEQTGKKWEVYKTGERPTP